MLRVYVDGPDNALLMRIQGRGRSTLKQYAEQDDGNDQQFPIMRPTASQHSRSSLMKIKRLDAICLSRSIGCRMLTTLLHLPNTRRHVGHYGRTLYGNCMGPDVRNRHR